MTFRRLAAASVIGSAAVLAGCGGDSGTGPAPAPTFENIAGTYAGVLVGISQGVAMEAIFSLTITQSSGNLSGSWSLAGTLNDGVIVVDIIGSGTLSGTIASGQNPSVNITFTNGLCPNHQDTFSGTFDSANNVITLNGPIDILDENCAVFLSYPSVIILTR